jgi:uncharacterized protein (TIGR00369 family)
MPTNVNEASGLTHSSEELLSRYHKTMGGRPVAELEFVEYTQERLVLRAELEQGHSRPGGMVAGPILFALVDTAAYFVTISRSPKRSEAHTSSISMEFLRPSPVGTLFVEARLLRFGKRSSVVDTMIRLGDGLEPVAHAVVTYAPLFPTISHE